MDGQSFSREVAFSQSVINIGADQGNDIVLRGNSVADFHVLMHYDSGRWSISPLNGAYRTTINGRSLDVEGAVLQNGSIVEIGTYRLTMMLNGVNTDIIIQSQSGTDTASMDSDSIGSDQNIQIEITKMDRTELDAGSAAEIELTVTNAGPLVANMQLQLQGIPSTWVQIIPPVLNLNEGRKGTFLVRISPPRNSSAEAGLYSLHFVAISPNYPRNTGIADTSLTILPYSEFLISGPTPMQLKLSHGKPTDIANFVIINNSNSVGSYFVQSRDDSNELNFAYQKTGSGALAAGQEMVTVRPGDSIQIPMEVTAKKIPLLGVSSKHHHYYTNVTPSDRPGDAQTIAGEVMIKPAINTMLLLLLLAVLIIAVGFIFQPYIHLFECQEGRRSQVIVAGSAAQLSWNVSGFASRITLNNGETDTEVSANVTQYVSPTVSTTYTLTAENFISSLLHITHKKIVQVLVVPSRPAIDVFSVDKGKALYDETVTLNWSVEPNATAASITSNKSTTQLAAENYTGKLAQGYQSDTLISLKAQNDSGYDLKSLFINVASDSITLKKFTVWVRPNGIAIPEDNDVRRTTRWGALELTGGTEQPVRSGASGVNPQPAAQSNTLEIPDDYNSTGAGTQLLNPEVMAAAGQPMPSTGTYSYQPPAAGSGSAPSELLVSPSLNAAAVPTAADPTASAGDPVIVRPAVVPTASVPSVSAVSDSVVVRSTAVPAASPEGSSPNRDFSIKLAEVIEDPLADSGYRVISYYPNYVLQKQEQILVEWSVDGVSKVKIENLSGDDLQNTGSEYAYPEKSTTYTLTAQVGETKKAYSLPVNVAGDPDDGEGSGLKCDLKANATTLKVPGSVMLTWTGGGNNRVQLISSTQAEKENDDAEKKKEEEAKAKGEKYEQPKQNQPLTGGTIGDYLQPSGFMRVNVDKQTTFVLNAYDASNNVICTKSVEVKYEGGNDKKDIKLRITKIADENGVSQSVYGKGQMVSYTVALTDFVKGTDPTGAIAITDGTSTCSVNWPVNTCSFQAKKTGELTITAVYAGDDNYKKVTATAKEIVIDKWPTRIQINSAMKPATDKADVVVQLLWDKHPYGMLPSGTISLAIGSGACDFDVDTGVFSGCSAEMPDDPEYKEEEKEKDGVKYVEASVAFSVKNIGLKDTAADRVTATYKGDAYFMPSTSQSVLFLKVPTTLKIDSAIKYDETYADIVALLDWDKDKTGGRTPTGIIKFTVKDGSEAPSTGDVTTGTCTLDIVKKTMNCEPGKADVVTGEKEITATIKKMLLADKTADRVKAEYSGDFIFTASESTTVLFVPIEKIPTTLELRKVAKPGALFANATADLTWDDTASDGKRPTGTITFTIGTGGETCVYTMDSGVFTCLEEGQTSITTYEDTDGIFTGEFIKMLLKTAGADRIKAAYSGDSYFEKSETNYYGFEKIDPNLTITKVTDDEGKEHQWYKPGQEKVRVYIDMPGAVEGTNPTGPVTIQIDSATCPVTYPQNFCSLDLSKVKGDLTVTATYNGDDNYLSGKAEYSPLKVQDPLTLKLDIVKITDAKGVEQKDSNDEYAYAVGEDLIVSINLSEYDDKEIPTGDIEVKFDVESSKCDSSGCKCTIAYPDEISCKLKAPNDKGGPYAVDAKYKGNPYYNEADADPVMVNITGFDINFDIRITNANESWVKDITNQWVKTGAPSEKIQPYYIMNQDVMFWWDVSGSQSDDPAGSIVWIKDNKHDKKVFEGSLSVVANSRTTITGSGYPWGYDTGNIPVEVRYDNDPVYSGKTAAGNLNVQRMITPDLYMLPAYRNTGGATGSLEFGFSYDSDLPEKYGVSPAIDETDKYNPDETHRKIIFTFKKGSDVKGICTFDLKDEKLLDCGLGSAVKETDGDIVWYTIEDVMYPDSALAEDAKADTIDGRYEGNTYFSEATDSGNIYQNQGWTEIQLRDALRYDVDNSTKSHAFFTAYLNYDKNITDAQGEKVKPSGKLKGLIGTVPYECDINNFSTCGTTTEEKEGRIKYVFECFDTVNSVSDVSVQFKSDQTTYFADSNVVTKTFEPDTVKVKITEAQRITSDRADIEFSIESSTSLPDTYEIFPKVRLGSRKDDSSAEKTCILNLQTLEFESGSSCAGAVTKTGNTYAISNFRGIIDKEDATLSVTLLPKYTKILEEEYPKASEVFAVEPIKTTLTISDLLKYNYTHGFATVTLAYDEDKAIAMDQYPGGRLHFISNTSEGDSASPRFCYYDLKTHELTPECPEGLSVAQVIDTEYGTNQYKILNLTVQERHTVLDVTYEMDDYYTDSTDSKTYTEELPSVTIRNTMKSETNEVYAAFTVNFGSLSEKYDLLQGFRFSSLSSGKVCQWSLSDGRFEPEEGEGGQYTPSSCSMDSLTNDGNLYVLKKLSGDFSTGDTKFSIGLANEYMAAADYPKAEADYSKIATTSIVNRVEAYELPDKRHTFLTYTLTYDKTYPEIYGLLPMGSVEMKMDSEGHDPTCTYYPATDSFDGCVGEVKTSEPGTLKLQFRNILTAYNDTYWGAGKYNGDGFFVGSAHNNSIVSVRSDMGVSIKNLTRSSNFQMVSASFRINYLPSIIEYGIFESAYIYAASSNELGMNSPDGSYSSVIINLQTLEANLRGGTVTKSSDGYTLNVDQWGKNYTYGYFKSYPYFWVILKNSPYFGEDFILYDVKPFAATSSTFSATSASPVSMSIALGGQ